MIANERRIIKKVKKGNEKAFKQLYDAYAGYALRTAYNITKNNNHAADIVQETFIKVYRNIIQFDHTKSFKPWFYKILLNESRRYMKKQNKEPIADASEQLIDHVYVNMPQNEQQDKLLYALEKLNDMHSTVITLKYLNGFTEKEIAYLLELNVNTVKSRLFKARHALKSILGGEMDE